MLMNVGHLVWKLDHGRSISWTSVEKLIKFGSGRNLDKNTYLM